MKSKYVEQGEINEYLEGVKKRHGSYRKAAKKAGINSAYFTLANKGQVYPRLLRALNITLSPPRTRLTIDCTPALIARFDNQRGERSRRDWLARLIDLADGVGEIV